MEDWEFSSGEETDIEVNLKDTNDAELYYISASLSKLQFRSDVSKARWIDELGMGEVFEKKGKMWITTGIVRDGKTYCSIEEALFLVEIGALLLMDDNDKCLSLEDMHGKINDKKSGCCWELFEVYKHLKSLGYIVGRHNVPWTMKGVESNNKSDFFQGTPENKRVADTELEDTSVVQMLNNLQVDELRPAFDIYPPSSKFRKTAPGHPTFLLCLVRASPPSRQNIEALERQCGGIPLKICHVEHGHVTFFSFKRVELPVLP